MIPMKKKRPCAHCQLIGNLLKTTLMLMSFFAQSIFLCLRMKNDALFLV